MYLSTTVSQLTTSSTLSTSLGGECRRPASTVQQTVQYYCRKIQQQEKLRLQRRLRLDYDYWAAVHLRVARSTHYTPGIHCRHVLQRMLQLRRLVVGWSRGCIVVKRLN